MREREKGRRRRVERRREMEKLSLMEPIEIPYDIIYDIKKARIWHLKMPKVITILVLIFKMVYKHALTFERSPPRSREERQTF
jgi:hypothetical protein